MPPSTIDIREQYSGTLVADLQSLVHFVEADANFRLSIPCWHPHKPFFPGFLGTCDWSDEYGVCREPAVVVQLDGEQQEFCLRHFWEMER